MDNDPKQSAQFVAHSSVIPRRPWVLSKQGEMTYVLSQDGEVILGDRACKAMPEDMLKFLIAAANGYSPNDKSIQIVRDREPRYSKMELDRAVTACCTCGGGGPGEKHTCPACEMYHALVTVSRQES